MSFPVPVDVWNHFYADFSKIARLWVEEGQLKSRLVAIGGELRELQKVPVLPPTAELEALRLEIAAELDEAEAAACRDAVRGSNLFQRLLELRREDTRIGEAATSRRAVFSARWRKHEAASVMEFGAIRRLFAASLDYQRERIVAGEIPDEHIPAAKKEAGLEKLKQERQDIQRRLKGPRFTPAWRYTSGHPRRDYLGLMIGEYLSSQKNADFPVDPKYRIRTSAAWGNVTAASDPAAASITLAAEHLEAWQEFVNYTEVNHGR
jgi:hypothetical protein